MVEEKLRVVEVSCCREEVVTGVWGLSALKGVAGKVCAGKVCAAPASTRCLLVGLLFHSSSTVLVDILNDKVQIRIENRLACNCAIGNVICLVRNDIRRRDL